MMTSHKIFHDQFKINSPYVEEKKARYSEGISRPHVDFGKTVVLVGIVQVLNKAKGEETMRET